MKLPDGFSASNIHDLQLAGTHGATGRAGDVVTTSWNGLEIIWDFYSREVAADDPDAEAQLAAALGRWGHEPARAAVARNVMAIAAEAEGANVSDLTPRQVRALLIALLWDYKAIGDDLRVKPVSDWMRRKIGQ